MFELFHVDCWSESSESKMLAVGMDLEERKRVERKRNEVSSPLPLVPSLPPPTPSHSQLEETESR